MKISKRNLRKLRELEEEEVRKLTLEEKFNILDMMWERLLLRNLSNKNWEEKIKTQN